MLSVAQPEQIFSFAYLSRSKNLLCESRWATCRSIPGLLVVFPPGYTIRTRGSVEVSPALQQHPYRELTVFSCFGAERRPLLECSFGDGLPRSYVNVAVAFGCAREGPVLAATSRWAARTLPVQEGGECWVSCVTRDPRSPACVMDPAHEQSQGKMWPDPDFSRLWDVNVKNVLRAGPDK
ncbi:hypothetical protein AV530_010226 [Patagioenas fasciata monilis]|uniref:Uncharacterized protein n=1 Tax=Patagioenas fasciata monilis TaxID=372326 RepID=A0A1V4L033_PATFA|nr:hypothetical protein AV530_010226 [Patagioenas fasciata monilis]